MTPGLTQGYSCDVVPRDRFVIGTTYTLSRDAVDAAGNPADARVWAVCELWDFGVAADITPPPDEVAPPHEVFGHIPRPSV